MQSKLRSAGQAREGVLTAVVIGDTVRVHVKIREGDRERIPGL